MKNAGKVGRRFACLFLACCAAPEAWTASSATAAHEDPIVAAKRDYEAIKSVTANGEQQKLAIPAAGMPQLDLKADAAPVLSPIARHRAEATLQAKAGTHTKDWLVDAMKEDQGGRTGNPVKQPPSFHRDMSRENLGLRSDSLLPLRVTPQGENGGPAGRSQGGQGDAIANPLTQYMSSWMTPQDHALLVPQQGSSQGISDAGSGLAALAGTDGRTPAFVELRANRGAVLGDPAALNPYLTATVVTPGTVDVDRVVSAPGGPVFPATSANLPPHSKGTTSLSETERPPMREVLKPDPDAKYFKQLKRF